jgi:hypothetical protein
VTVHRIDLAPERPAKPRPTLLPARALRRVAGLMAAQESGHGGARWKGRAADHHLDAAWRHLLAHQAGETHDPDSGRPHLEHFATRALMALDVTPESESPT